ncbi:MAG: rRNA maturation RNase YbeY [Candidatus Riflebacteria bacterium]|nr:rRNA maturation RNase YbeY [Candidatus Riflebacteria bacterium]
MEVLINNRQKKIRLNTRRIRLIAEEILRFEGAPDNAELSLVFCDDDFIQKLNHQHLGRNEPTDVLSFPLEEDEFESGDRLLGDVVISVETACRQALKLRHSVGLEIVYLLIHGLLHLQEYDHQRKDELKRMREREVTIFSHLCERKMLKGIEVVEHPPLIKRAGEPGPRRKPAARPSRKPDITEN